MIRKDIDSGREIILTVNGKPFAVVSRVGPDSVEDEILAIRRARVRIALGRIRARAKANGLDNMSMTEINTIIAKARSKKRGGK